LSLEEKIQQLLDNGRGNVGRLNHILTKVKNGKHLWDSDQEYLKILLAESDSTENSEIIEIREKLEAGESVSQEQVEKEPPKQVKQNQTLEIEQLRKEIHKLQEKNHVIEEHLQNQGGKKGSMARALGRGIGGVFLFLFGLGMVLLTYAYFDNIDNSMRNMGYGGDPLSMMIFFFIVIPGILLSIGGISIYYGIRIISKT